MKGIQQPKEKKNNWIWIIVAVAAFFFVAKGCGSGTGGPQYPLDPWAAEDADMAAEVQEGKQQSEVIDNDPCLQDTLNHVPPEYSLCPLSSQLNDHMDEPAYSESESGCPYGCEYRKEGCDIKGNISFDTNEKIYHLPGQEFYSGTTINPDNGERWFCTEDEAIANGWRKSYK